MIARLRRQIKLKFHGRTRGVNTPQYIYMCIIFGFSHLSLLIKLAKECQFICVEYYVVHVYNVYIYHAYRIYRMCDQIYNMCCMSLRGG